jgi:uncharacterized protein (UPF0335 family)
MFDFKDLLNEISGDEFEERPVDLDEFFYSPDYLGLKITLSEYQKQLIEISSQIYREETLINLYGEDEGRRRAALNYSEIIYVLGKGSGKDLCSEIALAYVCHLLLCLKSPAEYFGKDTGDAIDIINVAINADQANNVFFGGFKRIISKSPWFAGRFKDKQRHFAFDKNINVYSGHSEAEAFEGYNTLFVVLDEISGFDSEQSKPGEENSKAKILYDMYSDSITSRFPNNGKMLLLSFPRYKEDFIMKKYNKAIAIKEVVQRTHTFKINEGLPDGTKGNEFTIFWDEDHIVKYEQPGVFCLKRPSWEVNPSRDIRDYMKRFMDDPVMALKKYACMPPESESAFFTSREKIEHAFKASNGIDEDGRFEKDFQPDPEKRYYVHVDLARLHDRCAVALAHVDHFERRDIGGNQSEPAPVVKVDLLKYWTPSSDKHVDFTEVREFIVSLQRRGFNISVVSFDRWESADISKELRQYGLRVERLSVAKKHYTDMAMVVHEERLSGPYDQILIDELLQLRVMPNDKIDHPSKGSKDLSDAVCGAIFNAIEYTPRGDSEIVVKTIETLRAEVKTEATNIQPKDGVIRPPKRGGPMPDDLAAFLEGMRVIGS